MKKYLIVFCLILAGITSCEKDDFCDQNPVTPNLILRFYDINNTTQLKTVERLSIIAQSKTDSLYTNQNTDSIAIPLNSLTEKTIYTLKTNTVNGATANNQIATLTITYTPKNEFVSRSCGFRVIFNDATFEKTGWINSLSTNSIPTINNQANAHLKIYH